VLLGRGAWVATCFESGSRGLEGVYIVEFRRYVHGRIYLTILEHREHDHIGERQFKRLLVTRTRVKRRCSSPTSSCRVPSFLFHEYSIHSQPQW